MFANTSNNIQEPRLDNLRQMFPKGEVDDNRNAICAAALQSMADFKKSAESKGCNLFNESKDDDCQANFAGMTTSIKIAMKNPNLKKVNGMLDDVSVRILPVLEEDLKSFKAADPDTKRKQTYEDAIKLISEIKNAVHLEGPNNSLAP
jgi:hypothetical protein